MSTPLLAGKAALITGAAGGLGRALTVGLIAAGARVLATDVDEKNLGLLARDIEARGASAQLATHRLDISDPTACVAAVAAAEKAFGKLDILLNNGALGMARCAPIT